MKEKIILLVMSVLMGNCVLLAQNYYDDDIYYDASKVQKVDKKKKSNLDYDGSDVYNVNGTMTVDVDTYNRRNLNSVVDTSGIDSLASKDFLYTRRIERFYDPDVVKNSGDSVLIAYYNNSLDDEDVDVNIYLGGSPYWTPYGYRYNWYGYPYWSSSFYWDYWYGPSWTWNYSPYWSWYGWWGSSWYPGPSYYPPYHPHHPPHYGYNPAINRRPASPGAYRPVRPGYNDYRNGHRNGYRYNDYRPSNKKDKSSVVGRRPGANKRSDYDADRNYNNSHDRNKSSYSPSRSGSRSSGFSGGGSRGGGGMRGGRSGRH